MATTKRKTDPADVLVNKLNVGLARHKKLLASWSSLSAGSGEAPNAHKNASMGDEDDFKDEALGYEQLGIGGRIPKDVQDGSFTRRTLTSNDKLLTQLMGKKAAKAHIAARQRPQAASSQSQGPGSSQKFKFVKPVESEDEEEGRAAAFKSKKKKRKIEVVSKSDAEGSTKESGEVSEPSHTTKSAPTEDSEAEDDGAASQAKKAKTGSYLDQILAERSKKKKNKKKKAAANTDP